MSTCLPEAAQKVVGLTHRDTAPARKMLEAEGLRYENHVDIFDAGPVLECHIADLRTVRESVLVPVHIVEPGERNEESDGAQSRIEYIAGRFSRRRDGGRSRGTARSCSPPRKPPHCA